MPVMRYQYHLLLIFVLFPQETAAESITTVVEWYLEDFGRFRVYGGFKVYNCSPLNKWDTINYVNDRSLAIMDNDPRPPYVNSSYPGRNPTEFLRIL